MLSDIIALQPHGVVAAETIKQKVTEGDIGAAIQMAEDCCPNIFEVGILIYASGCSQSMQRPALLSRHTRLHAVFSSRNQTRTQASLLQKVN